LPFNRAGPYPHPDPLKGRWEWEPSVEQVRLARRIPERVMGVLGRRSGMHRPYPAV
jgi:hypothetical protein